MLITTNNNSDFDPDVAGNDKFGSLSPIEQNIGKWVSEPW